MTIKCTCLPQRPDAPAHRADCPVCSVKHTSGPWISTLIHPQYILNSKQQAFLVISRDNGPTIDDSEFNSDCRLIAASPEMLSALEDALESLKRLPDVDGAYRVTCIQQCEAAIRRAKGE